MTGPRPQRTCQGCGYKFTPDGPDDRFCSTYCERSAAMAEIYAAIQRQA
jgi:hypothetical protein